MLHAQSKVFHDFSAVCFTVQTINHSFIPEQFTVKAYPALFEEEGGGRGRGKNIEEHFSELTHEYWANTFSS